MSFKQFSDAVKKPKPVKPASDGSTAQTKTAPAEDTAKNS